jgi:hypothetical protein
MALEWAGFIEVQIRYFGKRDQQYQSVKRKSDNLPLNYSPFLQRPQILISEAAHLGLTAGFTDDVSTAWHQPWFMASCTRFQVGCNGAAIPIRRSADFGSALAAQPTSRPREPAIEVSGVRSS